MVEKLVVSTSTTTYGSQLDPFTCIYSFWLKCVLLKNSALLVKCVSSLVAIEDAREDERQRISKRLLNNNLWIYSTFYVFFLYKILGFNHYEAHWIEVKIIAIMMFIIILKLFTHPKMLAKLIADTAYTFMCNCACL